MQNLKSNPSGNSNLLSKDEELSLLKQEILELKKQLTNLSQPKSMTEERDAIVFYIELCAAKISGIPSFSNLIREVLHDLATKVKDGEHFKLDSKFKNWRNNG